MRRQRGHLRVADAMEQIYGDRVDRYASDVAQHLYQAGVAADPDKTVRFLTLAGQQAMETGAFDGALRLFDDALSIHAEQDGDHRQSEADLHYQKGQALRGIGKTDEAVSAWRAARAHYVELHDDASIAQAVNAAWNTLQWGGRADAAREEAEQGLEVLSPPAVAERCQLMSMVGLSLGLAGRSGGSTLLRDAMSIAEEVGDEGLRADVSAQKSWHDHHYLRTEASLHAARGAEAYFRSVSRPYFLADVLSTAGMVLTYMGRFDDLFALCVEAEPLASRVGHLGARCMTTSSRIWATALSTGDLQTGLLEVREELEFEQGAGYAWSAEIENVLGAMLFWRGLWREAEQVYGEAVENEPRSFWTPTSRVNLLLLRVYGGDTQAGDELRRIGEDLAPDEPERLFGEWESVLCAIEGLAVRGERPAAAGAQASSRHRAARDPPLVYPDAARPRPARRPRRGANVARRGDRAIRTDRDAETRRHGPGDAWRYRVTRAPLCALSGARSRDVEVLADLSSEQFVDFSVTRNCRDLPGPGIDVDSVLRALSQQPAALCLKMSDESAALHGGAFNGSRITSAPAISSSASARLASRVSSTASARLALASSSVAPCVLAPGSSSTKAMYPSGTRRNTAVNSICIVTSGSHDSPVRHSDTACGMTGPPRGLA